jgi:hypothetical protein
MYQFFWTVTDLLGISYAAFGDHPAPLGILLTRIKAAQ